VDFEAHSVPTKLPNDISLCLYRVAQESLQNVIRHSGATSANVALTFDGDGLHLTVADDGCGFDRSGAREKDSLGLINIDERMRSVNGEAFIESVPGGGTRVDVRVHLNGVAGHT